MKWKIPAKTFLLGEYAAITGAPAIILTTTPCFEVTLTNVAGFKGVHPDSPAGRYWAEQAFTEVGLTWHDPYQGRGGMGASTAQFLGAYFATTHLLNKTVHHNEMLNAYLRTAWNGIGTPPSGYDVLAQSSSGCVYINKLNNICQPLSWPFNDLAFVLLHTGQKLATHQHLQTLTLSTHLQTLTTIANAAKIAFDSADSERLINAINDYHQQLHNLNLIAEHSLQHIQTLQKNPDVLAIKGCGAMGADILLLIVPTKRLVAMSKDFRNSDWPVMATSQMIYKNEKNT